MQSPTGYRDRNVSRQQEFAGSRGTLLRHRIRDRRALAANFTGMPSDQRACRKKETPRS